MRTAKDVIDQAIKDNRVPELLLYGAAGVFVAAGTTLLILAFFNGHTLNAIAGVVLDGLAWPATNMTREIRQQNMMLRMLEVPLTKAETADEAAKMLTEAFGNHFKFSPSKQKNGNDAK